MRERINDILTEMRKRKFSPEEKAVMRILVGAWEGGEPRHITQSEIAKSEGWLGCHEKHELDKVQNPTETTLRKVRQIIRDLRLNHGAPILSDRNGYWIPSSSSEVREYLDRIEIEAKAQAKAWFETYASVRKTFSMTSSFFEESAPLFQGEPIPVTPTP